MTLEGLLTVAVADAKAMVASVDAPPIATVHRRRLWAAVAAGVALVLVFAAIGVVMRGLIGPEPPVVTEVTTTTAPPEFELLPDSLGAFPVETPLGAWTWTRIDGDESSLPDGGFFYADGRYFAITQNGLWASDEGINWIIERSDFNPDTYAMVDNTNDVWMIQYPEGIPALFRWDGGELTPVDIPLPVPEIEGMSWFPRGIHKIVTIDDRTFATVSSGGSMDWTEVFGAAAIEEWDYEAQTVTLREWNGEIPDLTLDVRIQPGVEAVEFSHPETGEVVLRVDTAGTGLVAEQLVGDQRTSWSLVVDSGSGFELAEAPWGDIAVDVVDIAMGSGGLVAAGLEIRTWPDPDADPVLHVWRSQDGVSWQSLQAPQLPEGVDRIELVGNGERLHLLGRIVDADPGAALYTSLDGSDWRQLDLDFGLAFPNRLIPTSYGWVMTLSRQFQAPSGEFWFETWDVWMSSDGLTWSRLPRAPDVTSYELNGGMASSGGNPVGDLVFVVTGWVDGSRHFWVGRFDS
ncbi:MAG: hypothetical protein WD651_01090 [Acidimicrobiia bacterium]